jgi:hypothetical protein
MSTLHIEEYTSVLKDINGDLADVPHIYVGQAQLTYTTSSVRTSFAFDNNTRYVIVHADADSYIALGDSTVVATQNDRLVPADTFRTFGLQQGATYIAVIEKV